MLDGDKTDGPLISEKDLQNLYFYLCKCTPEKKDPFDKYDLQDLNEFFQYVSSQLNFDNSFYAIRKPSLSKRRRSSRASRRDEKEKSSSTHKGKKYLRESREKTALDDVNDLKTLNSDARRISLSNHQPLETQGNELSLLLDSYRANTLDDRKLSIGTKKLKYDFKMKDSNEGKNVSKSSRSRSRSYSRSRSSSPRKSPQGTQQLEENTRKLENILPALPKKPEGRRSFMRSATLTLISSNRILDEEDVKAESSRATMEGKATGQSVSAGYSFGDDDRVISKPEPDPDTGPDLNSDLGSLNPTAIAMTSSPRVSSTTPTTTPRRLASSQLVKLAKNSMTVSAVSMDVITSTASRPKLVRSSTSKQSKSRKTKDTTSCNSDQNANLDKKPSTNKSLLPVVMTGLRASNINNKLLRTRIDVEDIRNKITDAWSKPYQETPASKDLPRLASRISVNSYKKGSNLHFTTTEAMSTREATTFIVLSVSSPPPSSPFPTRVGQWIFCTSPLL
eukprot:TRINITY_DN3919_c1_g3_i6.p1 TRINITY_DN3919_c1_g3~~TRINITY_DN3919_c1_g3_i6.p1  ORF type:complete len:506 (-),score=82.05 TRINITY_DN3919_c1_g3_i6:763-2280(-)